MLPHVPGVQMQNIPDDIMDVDRVVDEDKDSNPNKRISQLQRDRRVVDERELSDSEDEDGDKRRNQLNAKLAPNKRKASSESINGTAVNGNEEFLPANSAANTTITQVTKMSKTTVITPSTTNEKTENGPSDVTTTSAEEIVPTIMKEEVTETTTVVVKDEPPTTTADENVPTEAATDGMDTSETS